MTKRILIADDHESVLRGLRAMLGANPAWKICGDAVDGKEAVVRATKLRPDLIVMDFAMPRMDGLTAAQEIHKLLPTVPRVRAFAANLCRQQQRNGRLSNCLATEDP